MNQNKICTKCNQEKKLSEFSKHKRDGFQYNCKACVKLYYQDNKHLQLTKKQQYYETNKYKRQQYYETNKPIILAKLKQRYEANKEQILSEVKQYQQTPQGKAVKKADSQNRRAAKRNNGGKHTGTEILKLFDLQSGVCPYCKTKLHKTKHNSFHVDHILPLSKGGTNDISNLQLLCPKCNMNKHNKLPEEFAQTIGLLF